MLKLEGLSKSFGGVAATRDVSLEFTDGSFSAIIGPNGAGKTTLFNLITGRFAPDAGRILLAGENIAGLDRREIVRRGVGRAFQVASLFPSLTVEEALAAAVQAHQRRETVKLQSFPARVCRVARRRDHGDAEADARRRDRQPQSQPW